MKFCPVDTERYHIRLFSSVTSYTMLIMMVVCSVMAIFRSSDAIQPIQNHPAMDAKKMQKFLQQPQYSQQLVFRTSDYVVNPNTLVLRNSHSHNWFECNPALITQNTMQNYTTLIEVWDTLGKITIPFNGIGNICLNNSVGTELVFSTSRQPYGRYDYQTCFDNLEEDLTISTKNKNDTFWINITTYNTENKDICLPLQGGKITKNWVVVGQTSDKYNKKMLYMDIGYRKDDKQAEYDVFVGGAITTGLLFGLGLGVQIWMCTIYGFKRAFLFAL